MENIALVNKSNLEEIPNIYERSAMVVSNEAGFISNIGNFFSSKINVINEVFSKNSKKDSEGNVRVKEYNAHFRDLLKLKGKIKKLPGVITIDKVENVEIPVIMGMRTDLLTSVSLIVENRALLSIVGERLEELDDVVSNFLSSEAFRTSTRPLSVTDVGSETNKLTEVIDAIVDSGGMSDRKKIGELISNISSLSNVVDELDKLSDVVTVKSMMVISEKSKVLHERIEVLYEQLVNDELNVYEKRLQQLAHKLEDVAKLITVYTSVVYLINQLTISTTMVAKEIIKRS